MIWVRIFSGVYVRVFLGFNTGFFPLFYVTNFLGGVENIQLRTEVREDGDLGAVARYSGVPVNLQMSETRNLTICHGYTFHGTGNTVRRCQKFEISRRGGR
jgi:hypothetical protein